MRFFSLLLYWTDDDVGYNGFPETNITFDEIQRTHCTSELGQSVWVYNCIFELLEEYSNSGGALYYNFPGQMLIEKSTFVSCICSNHGGAIYQKNGECIIKQCCGFKCYSTNINLAGQFIFSELSNQISDSDKKNRVLDSSVSHSMKNINNPSNAEALDLVSGTIQINTVNLSNNICYYNSALYAYPSSSTSNTACLMTYSTINSNEANQYTIIWFNTNANYEISQSNIINNKVQTNSNNGLIESYGPTNIKDCCIMNNKAQYILKSFQTITLTRCSIDFTLNGNILGNVSILIEAKTSFIIPIICTEKEHYCNASYDSVNGITVNIPQIRTYYKQFKIKLFIRFSSIFHFMCRC